MRATRFIFPRRAERSATARPQKTNSNYRRGESAHSMAGRLVSPGSIFANTCPMNGARHFFASGGHRWVASARPPLGWGLGSAPLLVSLRRGLFEIRAVLSHKYLALRDSTNLILTAAVDNNRYALLRWKTGRRLEFTLQVSINRAFHLSLRAKCLFLGLCKFSSLTGAITSPKLAVRSTRNSVDHEAIEMKFLNGIR